MRRLILALTLVVGFGLMSPAQADPSPSTTTTQYVGPVASFPVHWCEDYRVWLEWCPPPDLAPPTTHPIPATHLTPTTRRLPPHQLPDTGLSIAGRLTIAGIAVGLGVFLVVWARRES